MYQYLIYVWLVFVLAFNSVFGFLKPVEKQTVTVNGSMAAVDALGRKTVSAGPSEKQVGIFYFLWAGEHGTAGPYNISEIVSAHPEAILSEENWMAAGGGPMTLFHHWGEPLFGYYVKADKWVLHKHCQMLTDAGVDFMVFDTTNGYPYSERVLDLIDVWYGYLEQGWKVPQLAFYTNANSPALMNQLYDELYENAALKAKYPRLDELWFQLDGKPMIVGNRGEELRSEVEKYFRIKEVQWPTDHKHSDGFPWIEFGTTLLTVGGYYKNSPRDKSIMNVSVAQHCDTCRFSASAWYGGNDHGRSWHNGKKDTSENAVQYGYNFAEQWNFALKLDPDIVFVTGFNEWIAMRLVFADDEPIGFCDNCDTEYSRDVEPSAGILGDNYYMQMVNYIAKFKGSTSRLPDGKNVTIDIDGGFSQWDSEKITAVYRDYSGDTVDRDCRGYGDLYYTDTSGRNDIVNAKVAEDADHLYFYVDATDALSPSSDNAWMTLFLNLNGKKEGYDFCINRTSPAGGSTAVERVTDNGYEAAGEAEIRFEGNRMMISVDKSILGLNDRKVSFTFKWADNYDENDLFSFYTKGDSAPYGRLNWVYGAAAGNGIGKEPLC